MTLDDQLRAMVAAEVARQLATSRPSTPDVVTVAEYARARSISTSTVRVAIREKRLDAVRIGRAVRVRSDAEIRRREPPRDVVSDRAMRILSGGKVR